MKKYRLIIGLIIFPLLIVIACGEEEKSDQGRVIAFDKAKRTITLIRDKDFLQYPNNRAMLPVTYDLPQDIIGIKPELKVGLRMKLDSANNQIIIYDPIDRNFKTIPYTLLDKKEGVLLDNSLVFDTNTNKPKKFPIIDRERKLITVYSRRQQILATFSLPQKFFDLPEYTWNAGDEVRIYYKKEGKALSLTNITKYGLVRD